MPSPCMKFQMLIVYIVMEGKMSQNSDFGPSFHFMESRKWHGDCSLTMTDLVGAQILGPVKYTVDTGESYFDEKQT